MDFEIIIQECSLGDCLQKLLKLFLLLNKMAARAINRKKALNDFFCETNGQILKIISQEGSMGYSLLKLLKLFCAFEQDGRQS